MSFLPTRFDLRVPSERTGRPVLPPVSARRACTCCDTRVATGWVLPNGDSVCGHCESIVARAKSFQGSLDGFTSHVQRIDEVELSAAARRYLSTRFCWS